MSMHASLTTEANAEQPPESEPVPIAHNPALLSVDQVIAHLFPAPTVGQLFYTRFRERASREQTILPDEPADTVAICTKSIATLARELRIGPDTTQKYVVIYRALGLLKKRKMMGKLAFAMSAGIYHPPDLLEANLTRLLQKSRPKLREMTSDVLARCKVSGLISQDFQAAAALLQDLLQPQQGETRRTLEQRLLQAGQVFSQVLSSMQNLPRARTREDAEWFHLPSVAPTKAVESTHTKPSGRHDEHHIDGKPPQSVHRGDSFAAHVTQESLQTAIQGRFEQEPPAQNPPNSFQQGDSAQPRTAQESTQTLTQGRFEQKAPMRNLPNLPHRGDSAAGTPDTSAVESTQPATPGRFNQEAAASNPPNLAAQVDSSTPVNVNVITLINTITLNVKPVAAFCCNALGEPLSKQPIYLKLFRDCERDAQAISAALLFTLVHRRDGTMRNPASVFLARCRDYHAQGVPDEVAALVKQYGSLTYAQLLDVLSKPASFTPPMRGALPSARPGYPPAYVTPASLSPLPRWGTIQRFIGVEDGRPGMRREEALQVIRLAQGDRRTKMCHVDLEPLADGSYAVLLDNTITAIPRQTYFYSVQDWQARTSAIQDCFELFGVARTGRQCLADALRARRAAK